MPQPCNCHGPAPLGALGAFEMPEQLTKINDTIANQKWYVVAAVAAVAAVVFFGGSKRR
jgi:hypothetical protein